MMKPLLASRLAGAVWGHLVADAVGVPYEFREASQIGEVVFGAKGSHQQPAGTWSDDGALMLALLDSLLGDAPDGPTRFDSEDQGRRALSWLRDGAYAPGAKVFDIGGTTGAGLRAFERGTPAIDAGPADDHASGNGSLMRILPLALVERDLDDATLVERAHIASRVTHGHARCQVACALYTLVAKRLLGGEARKAAFAGAKAGLQSIYHLDPAAGVHRAALDELLAWPSRGGRGFVIDSFWSAWDAFAGATSYRDAVERAVRYGRDTDTTAAIAGGLAGIHWGWEGIPADWLDGMRGHEIATPLIDRLVETAGWRTSTGSRLRVDLLNLDRVPAFDGAAGRVGITFLPGKKWSGGHAGDHWRDLATDAARLRELQVDTLFLLVEDHELAHSHVPNIGTALAAEGVALVRFPILDPRTPTNGPAFRAVVADLVTRVRDGEFVGIACRGGLDRSGMAAACLLREAGLEADEAIDRVHAARNHTLTRVEQQGYVQAWPPG